MSVSVGARLGPYEILAPLGAGGMGEVYRARDTLLDRIVAIKVLRTHLAADPDRRQRFEREARLISQLNHPHICTLFDVGHHEPSIGSEQAVDYLVMEYLEGHTLAERLARFERLPAKAGRLRARLKVAAARVSRIARWRTRVRPYSARAGRSKEPLNRTC